MRPTRVCLDVSQNMTVSSVEYARNSPCGREMHEVLLVSETSGYPETVEPADTSNCFIVLSDTTKKPVETSVVRRGYFYWDVHEPAAIRVVDVPDSNGTF